MKTEIFQKANTVFNTIRVIDRIIKLHKEEGTSCGFEFRIRLHNITLPNELTDLLISALEEHRVFLQNEFDQL